MRLFGWIAGSGSPARGPEEAYHLTPQPLAKGQTKEANSVEETTNVLGILHIQRGVGGSSGKMRVETNI